MLVMKLKFRVIKHFNSIGFCCIDEKLKMRNLITTHWKSDLWLGELQEKVIANGTVNLEQTILKAISFKINTSLTQATTTAEKSVAKNSFALAGFGDKYDGYFAYQIILGTPEMKI